LAPLQEEEEEEEEGAHIKSFGAHKYSKVQAQNSADEFFSEQAIR
jgi:hypothetical protein